MFWKGFSGEVSRNRRGMALEATFRDFLHLCGGSLATRLAGTSSLNTPVLRPVAVRRSDSARGCRGRRGVKATRHLRAPVGSRRALGRICLFLRHWDAFASRSLRPYVSQCGRRHLWCAGPGSGTHLFFSTAKARMLVSSAFARALMPDGCAAHRLRVMTDLRNLWPAARRALRRDRTG